ncbi:MAG: 16S rRNA (guanine(527)-N(7))-methyltransferase RsmG [Firmicutes bacterium]|jgi:16S rRNA (guanine527-N7)-methyltransferase|nr:16S rRNA (guanine(527)-N(7))-methyltransferase RsmG [Bacillota bacterium]MDD4335927.1 16S rRNA (guanine(527)-N(7))-methyltransferase RsmG [Bacillota bacterium]MDD4791843.1 16S rRNA (guanine(527)-N(7))-methyltransferase RsmG [Bacillota bacterium]
MDEFVHYLKQGANELGIDLPESKVDMFCIYKSKLLEANRAINLTSITDDQEVAVKHFVDSLSCLLVADTGDWRRLVDVGTGAGFPGLVLKIMNPEADALLLDSVGKKVDFVREVADSLGLDGVEAVHGRAEDLGKAAEYREKFDLAVGRGVASVSALAEYCLPFVRPGGLFVAMKGPRVIDEIEAGRKAIGILGGSEPELRHLALPYGAGERVLVIVKKERNTSKKYPRKAGVPARRPLGER